MKTFKQFIGEDGGAGGGAVGAVASGGSSSSAPTNSTAGIAPSIKDPPVSKQAQKKIRRQGEISASNTSMRKMVGSVNV